MNPPLKWAGGKRWLLPHLHPIYAQHTARRLVEPLCGGLAVALGLRPETALLNDINLHLINFYRALAQGRITVPSPPLDHEAYRAARDRFNALARGGQAQSTEAVNLFYLLNCTAFNGLCRYNRRGAFNVPFGRMKDRKQGIDLAAYGDLLNRWQFESGDFQALPIESSDFIYADPPYDQATVQYWSKPFTWEDQVRLAEWLANHSGPVVVSNSATPRIVKLYRDLGFRLRFLQAPRRLNPLSSKKKAHEMLAMRNV